MFEPTWTWPNVTFGKLFMWIGANNDQIDMTSYGLDELIWLMFKPTQTWPNFTFGQPFMWIGANRWIFWETKSKVGAKSLNRFYIALNLKENVGFFAIQNLVDIQSSRFWWYSFVFERMQRRLVWILFRKINFMRIYSLIHQHLVLFPCWGQLCGCGQPTLSSYTFS